MTAATKTLAFKWSNLPRLYREEGSLSGQGCLYHPHLPQRALLSLKSKQERMTSIFLKTNITTPGLLPPLLQDHNISDSSSIQREYSKSLSLAYTIE